MIPRPNVTGSAKCDVTKILIKLSCILCFCKVISVCFEWQI